MITMMRRVSAAIALCVAGVASAQPTAEAVSPDAYLALYLSPEFVRETVRTTGGLQLMKDRLIKVDHYSGSVIPNPRSEAYSDANVKRFLTDVDSTLTRWVAPLESTRDEQVALIRKKYLERGVRLTTNARSSDDPQIAAWVRARRDFIVDAYGIAAFADVLQYMRPELLHGPHLPGGYDERFALGNRLPFVAEMTSISAVLDSPDAAALLPARFDIARLRARERELRREDQRDKYLYLGRVDFHAVTPTISAVTEAWFHGILHVSGVQMLADLAVLRDRLDLLADAVK